jgi:hypothetical protein
MARAAPAASALENLRRIRQAECGSTTCCVPANGEPAVVRGRAACLFTLPGFRQTPTIPEQEANPGRKGRLDPTRHDRLGFESWTSGGAGFNGQPHVTNGAARPPCGCAGRSPKPRARAHTCRCARLRCRRVGAWRLRPAVSRPQPARYARASRSRRSQAPDTGIDYRWQHCWRRWPAGWRCRCSQEAHSGTGAAPP